MQGAAFFDQIEAVDAFDFAVGEELADHTEGSVVVSGLTEGRNQHAAVEDDEVDVGRGEDGQAPAGHFTGFGEGEFEDFEVE